MIAAIGYGPRRFNGLPENHFRFQQSIGSPFNPDAAVPPNGPNLAPLYRTFLV